MIERKDVMPVNFLKKERFTGSDRGMRYRMEKTQKEDGDVLAVTAWPEPYAYDATPEEQKVRAEFPFSEEGIRAGVDWLNAQRGRMMETADAAEEKPGEPARG